MIYIDCPNEIQSIDDIEETIPCGKQLGFIVYANQQPELVEQHCKCMYTIQQYSTLREEVITRSGH